MVKQNTIKLKQKLLVDLPILLILAFLTTNLVINAPIRPVVDIGQADITDIQKSIAQRYVLRPNDYIIVDYLGSDYKVINDSQGATDGFHKTVEYQYYIIQTNTKDDTVTIAVSAHGKKAERLSQGQTVELYGTISNLKEKFDNKFDKTYGNKLYLCLNDDTTLLEQIVTTVFSAAIIGIIIWTNVVLKKKTKQKSHKEIES